MQGRPSGSWRTGRSMIRDTLGLIGCPANFAFLPNPCNLARLPGNETGSKTALCLDGHKDFSRMSGEEKGRLIGCPQIHDLVFSDAKQIVWHVA